MRIDNVNNLAYVHLLLQPIVFYENHLTSRLAIPCLYFPVVLFSVQRKTGSINRISIGARLNSIS